MAKSPRSGGKGAKNSGRKKRIKFSPRSQPDASKKRKGKCSLLSSCFIHSLIQY